MAALDHEENFVKKLEEGHGGEGSMARKQLARTAELATMIQDSITDETNLEEWVESKITKAQDYLTSVLNYMRGDELVDKPTLQERGFGEGTPPSGEFYKKQVIEEDELEERKLSKAEDKEKEKVVKGMKKNKSDFEKRYGKDAKSVMYATATKIAKETA